MQAKLFLLINGLIVAVLVLRLILARKGMNPTPLDIRSSGVRSPEPHQPQLGGEKALNCYFTFNGMLFDAFEVLGLPSGSNKEACYRAYIDMRGRGDKLSQEVVEKAWEALQKHF